MLRGLSKNYLSVFVGRFPGEFRRSPSFSLVTHGMERGLVMISVRRVAWAAVVSAMAVIGVLGNSSEPALGGVRYIVTDLGDLGGYQSEAHGINAPGQVVGDSSDPTGTYRAFFWDEGNGLLQLTVPDGSTTVAYGINDAGSVSAYSSTLGGFIWDRTNGVQILGNLNGRAIYPRRINASGQVAGEYTNAAGDTRAFLWNQPTGLRDIGAFAGNRSSAQAINDVGTVVGDSYDSNNIYHAFIWDEVHGMRNLGFPCPAFQSAALDINNSSEVVGYTYEARGHPVGFLWNATSGTIQLGTLTPLGNSWAFGINDSGRVVGESTSSASRNVAVIWDETNGIQDLNLLLSGSGSVFLNRAIDINECGQIICDGITAQGDMHGFLLTPIPEPATLSLLALGGLALLRRRR